MTKVVYVYYVPLTERIHRDWCIGHLMDHGVPVEYWDITAVYPTGVGPSDPSLKGVVLIRDFEQLAERAARPEYADALFLLSMSYEARYQRLFRLFTRLDRRIGRVSWGYLPMSHESSASKLRVLLTRPAEGLRRGWAKAVGAVSRRTGRVKPFDVVFAAGRAAFAANARAKRLVPVNLCDYDNMREAMAAPGRLIEGRYAVFLDNNQAHNPDLALLGIPPLDAGRYFASLNRYFRLVEERFGLRVAVAAHPKSDYAPDLFEGRPILKGRTPELVRDCELVLCHHSTSIACAVIARKPLLFVYTRQMDELYRGTHVVPMKAFADYLGAPLAETDAARSASEIDVRPVDAARYEAYKYDFLTNPGTEDRFNRDLFLSEFSGGGR